MTARNTEIAGIRRSAAATDLLSKLKPQAANLLSASRFALAAIWLAAFVGANRRAEILGPIALAGALSDIADGLVARAMASAGGFGRWLDSIADVAFVLTALACEAATGAIPLYIPVLIAASFAQYAIDSLVIRGSAYPMKSRLGHWGGIINFALVIVLAFAPLPRWPGRFINAASPLIALFYIAAIVERTLNYRVRADR